MAIKETIPFNFDEIYKYVEDKFTSKGYDVQEGSNTMQLVTAMSYLTSMLNANTAVNINETLLTLARKRTNVLQNARVLGYEIAHIQSYQYDLTLTFDEGTHIIKKYTSFTAGTKSYYYMGDTIENVVFGPGGGTRVIRVIEGTLKKYINEPTLEVIITGVYDESLDADVPQHFIDIPFIDVENSGIEMFITYIDEFGVLHDEEWEKSSQFMIDKDTILNKEYVRIDNIEYRTPRVYFKLGDVGKELRIGSIVKMNVLVSSGSTGGIVGDITPLELPATVTNYTLVIQGADEESTESIKENAPLFYNSANRLVTKTDYIAFSNRQPAVRYTYVWDGQDEFPKRPGNIWFSFVPDTLSRVITDTVSPGRQWDLTQLTDYPNWYLEDEEIQGVWDKLDGFKIPTLEYNHRHPVYLDFSFDVKIARYAVKTSISDINTQVFEVIDNYFKSDTSTNVLVEDTDTAETFGYEYFQSNLIKRVDTSLTDIMGFDITLTTTIGITEKDVLTEYDHGGNVYNKVVCLHIGVPFDGIFDTNNDVVFSKLPVIDTPNFIGTSTIFTDETTVVIDAVNKITTYDIKIGADVVGKYKVFDATDRFIEISLFVTDSVDDADGTSFYTTGIDIADLRTTNVDAPRILNVAYATPNIPAVRNTIPRLKQVKFT